MAVAAPRRRADRDEHRVGALTPSARSVVNCKRPAATLLATRSIEARLVNRHFAAQQRVDLGLVLVDADDVVAEIGEAGARNQADIA
jgi:hypothetical protein